MSDLLDAASRNRIVTDLSQSLIVEAGAGSGKTHEMARRMAAGIAAGVYQVEHMAAVTFTRKAAAELRGRFQLALEEELTSALSNPDTINPEIIDRATRLRSALSNIERTLSGTIHSFCARLLRERPIEAGVAPGFTELDDVEERLMRESSWRDFRAQARAVGDADLALLNEAGIKAKDLDGAFAAVCNYEDVDFPAKDTPAPDVDQAWKALDAFWTTLQTYRPSAIDPRTTCKTQKKILQFERAWSFAQRRPRTPARLAELLTTWDFEPGITQNRWADDAAGKKRANSTVPPLHEQFRSDAVTPWLHSWRRHLYAPCIRLLCKARAAAARDRQLRNTLSFNDLLIRTAKVLRENEPVRRALQDKYRWLFVDEFQDTDPLQAEIMFAFRTLYVVGDPKQSIYRFRRADIDIYNHVRSVIGGPSGENVVSLTTNFRSVPALCDWANLVFETKFGTQSTVYSPAFAKLDPAPKEDGSAILPNGARGLQTPGTGLFTLTSNSAAEEAASIARYIRSEVDADRRGFGDFLILTRKRKSLQSLVDALEALQIPIEVSGAGAFGDSAEVRELSQLLQALADPQDSVALVGVLRGPLFGLSDRALFAWRQAGGYFGLFAELEEAATGGSDGAPGLQPRGVGRALAQLKVWHHYTRVLPAGAALERILEDSGYLALAATTPGGVEAGDLLHAVDRVRAAVEAGFTLAEAAEALQDAAQESNEIESWPLEPGRPDVVRVMNLHKAKGLESPVVFLADPQGGYSPDADIRIVRGGSDARSDVRSPGALDRRRPCEGGSAPGIGYLPIVRKSDTSFAKTTLALPPDWDTHAAEEQRYLEAEQDRLLYVAATRAKSMLVVGRSSKASKNTAWSGLDEFLANARELEVPDTVAVPTPAHVDVSARAASNVAIASAASHASANQPSWFATSVTEEVRRAQTARTASALAAAIDPTSVLVSDTPSKRADAGVAWGTLVHGLLEHAMRFPKTTRDDLHRMALWLTVDEPELRPLIGEAVATVEGVARADFWVAARESSEPHEEAPFAVCDRVGDLHGVLSGVIDLVYRTADAWQIVDYKTDVTGGEQQLAAKYSDQMRAYERGWKAVAGGTARAELVQTRKG